MRIQDSRTDFGGFLGILVDSTSTRGWCKIDEWSGDTTWRERYRVEKIVRLQKILELCVHYSSVVCACNVYVCYNWIK